MTFSRSCDFWPYRPQLQRESQKAEKKSKEEGKKVLAAMQKGDMEIVKIHAGNAIRERTQAVNFMRLSSRIDAVAGRWVALMIATESVFGHGRLRVLHPPPAQLIWPPVARFPSSASAALRPPSA